MQIPLSLSVGLRSQPSNVFMVMELAIRITAFVRDPTQVIMNATSSYFKFGRKISQNLT